jgi:hypothetical protein
VAIENGTTTTGIGGKFKQQLADDGYDINVASVSDALASTYATSEIIDYTGGKRPHTVAYLEGLLNVKKVTAPPTSLVDPPANIVVILGADYAAKVSPTSTSSSTSNSATQ